MLKGAKEGCRVSSYWPATQPNRPSPSRTVSAKYLNFEHLILDGNAVALLLTDKMAFVSGAVAGCRYRSSHPLPFGSSLPWRFNALAVGYHVLRVHGMLIRHCLSGDEIAVFRDIRICSAMPQPLRWPVTQVSPKKPLHEPLVVCSISEPQPVYQDLLNVSTVPARVC